MKAVVLELLDFYGQRLRGHWPGYLHEFRWYLSALLLATLADFYSTHRFMAAGGIEDELHPVIRWVSLLCGPFLGPLLGKLGQFAAVVFVTVLFRPQARIVFIPVTLVYFYAAWFNLWGISLYTPLFLKWLSS